MTRKKDIGDHVNQLFDELKNYSKRLRDELRYENEQRRTTNSKRKQQSEKRKREREEEFEECIPKILNILNSKDLRYILAESVNEIELKSKPTYCYLLTGKGVYRNAWYYKECDLDEDWFGKNKIKDPIDETKILEIFEKKEINCAYLGKIEKKIRMILQEDKP